MVGGLIRFLRQILALVIIAAAGTDIWIAKDGITDEGSQTDVGLVAGSGMRPDGIPELALRSCLDGATERYSEGRFPFIIVSGKNKEETKGMESYLVAHQIPPEAIIMDSTGENNQATAKAVVKIMKERNFHSVMIVSNYYRITRMKLALQHAGISQIQQTHVDKPQMENVPAFMSEALALWQDLFTLVLKPGLDQFLNPPHGEALAPKEALPQDAPKAQPEIHPDKH
jgi:vancomycin permeability regulator SanA